MVNKGLFFICCRISTNDSPFTNFETCRGYEAKYGLYVHLQLPGSVFVGQLINMSVNICII